MSVVSGIAAAADPERVVRWGYFLGVAFQIEDDLRNLSADATYGKELNGDLFEAKRTLLLIHARTVCDEGERSRLDAFLAQGRDQRSPEDVLWLAGLMNDRGSFDYARSVATALGGAASHEFTLAYGGLSPSEDLSFLAGLVNWVFERP